MIRMIHSERNVRFLSWRCAYAYCKPFSTVFFATVQTFPLEPKLPLASFKTFFLRARDATALTERGILVKFLKSCQRRGSPAFFGADSLQLINSAGRLFDQQVLDFGLVGRRNRTRVAEVTLLFRRLFGQDVTVISVFTLDLSCAGEGKTLLRSGIGFHFRHCRK